MAELLLRKLRCKTVCAIRVDKEAYVRGICEGVEHCLWSSGSHPACRGICAVRSSKPLHLCTSVRTEGGGLLIEESEVKAPGPVTLNSCTRLIHHLLSWMSGVLLSLLLTLKSTLNHHRLWKHRLQ